MSLTTVTLPIILAVLKVAVVALVGFVLARRGLLHSAALTDLSNLVIQVTVPCLIFANAAAGFTGTSLASVGLAVLSAPIVLGLGYLGGQGLAHLLRVKPGHWRPVVCASTFQNQAYLPLAVATAVLPSLAGQFPSGGASSGAAIAGSGVVAISLFGVFYSPLFWGLGLWWLTAELGESAQAKNMWRRVMPPPVIGVLLGYLFGLTPLHLALTPPRAPLHLAFAAISDIGSLTIPLANLILGGMLAGVGAGRLIQFRDVATVALAKLVWVPASVLGLLWVIRPWWRGDAALSVAAFIVFLQAITPPATNLAVMTRGKSLGMGGETAAVIPGLLLVAYPLALLTMPLWLTLFFYLLRTH